MPRALRRSRRHRDRPHAGLGRGVRADGAELALAAEGRSPSLGGPDGGPLGGLPYVGAAAPGLLATKLGGGRGGQRERASHVVILSQSKLRCLFGRQDCCPQGTASVWCERRVEERARGGARGQESKRAGERSRSYFMTETASALWPSAGAAPPADSLAPR